MAGRRRSCLEDGAIRAALGFPRPEREGPLPTAAPQVLEPVRFAARLTGSAHDKSTVDSQAGGQGRPDGATRDDGGDRWQHGPAGDSAHESGVPGDGLAR